MNTFRHDDEQRRKWVQDKAAKRKTVKQICKEAQISRATLYNWIDEFKEKAVGREQPVQIDSGLAGIQGNTGKQQGAAISKTNGHLPEIKTLPIHHAATQHRMLLAALDKIDTDKSISRKLAATLVKRFTLSIAQACEITGIDETTYGYKPRKPEVDDRLVQGAILQLLANDATTSFEDCCATLLKEHPDWTRKQIKRVYREGRLYLKRQRSRGGKTDSIKLPNFPAHPHRPGACWNLGVLQNSKNFLLFIMDDTDAMLLNTATINGAVTSEAITTFLSRAAEENGKPRRLRIPAREPFNIKELTGWAFKNKVSLLTLSMTKPENELEVQGMEETVREQMEAAMVHG